MSARNLMKAAKKGKKNMVSKIVTRLLILSMIASCGLKESNIEQKSHYLAFVEIAFEWQDGIFGIDSLSCDLTIRLYGQNYIESHLLPDADLIDVFIDEENVNIWRYLPRQFQLKKVNTKKLLFDVRDVSSFQIYEMSSSIIFNKDEKEELISELKSL